MKVIKEDSVKKNRGNSIFLLYSETKQYLLFVYLFFAVSFLMVCIIFLWLNQRYLFDSLNSWMYFFDKRISVHKIRAEDLKKGELSLSYANQEFYLSRHISEIEKLRDGEFYKIQLTSQIDSSRYFIFSEGRSDDFNFIILGPLGYLTEITQNRWVIKIVYKGRILYSSQSGGDLDKVIPPSFSFNKLSCGISNFASFRDYPEIRLYITHDITYEFYTFIFILMIISILFISILKRNERLRKQLTTLTKEEKSLNEVMSYIAKWGLENWEIYAKLSDLKNNFLVYDDMLQKISLSFYETSVIKKTLSIHIKNTCSMIDEIIQKGKTIQESEERYRKMINSMPDAVLEIDSVGNILFCSGQVLNSLGYNPDALIGKNIFDLVDSDLREDIRTKFSDSVRQSYYFRNLVFPVKSSKGTDVIMELNGYTFFGENSLPSGFRMVSRDITERLRLQNEKRKMEKQLMQAQKMEALGTLAGGIAHDFNNVLAAIIGSLEMLSFNIKNGNLGSDKELDKYIELAYDSAKKASEVIKQLLKISGKNHLSTERVNLNMTINSVTNLCKNSFPKSINISYNSAIENAIVCCDPLQFEQAILNICINAMHAMTIMRNDDEKRGGVIDITLSQMFDENNIKNITPYNVSGKYYKIDIRDTGVGIDKDKLEHIFEPFYTTKGEGTGLGLFMVYNTIKEMGGFITVDSVPGEGTCFSLYIPVLTE